MNNVTQTPIRMPLWQPLFIFLVFLLSAQKIQAQCTCTGNLVANPSFESGTTSWTWSGGNFNAGTGAVKCGSKSGDFEITNTSSNSVYQVIGTDLAVGTVVNASVWAGTHNNSYSHKVFIHFYNASNVYMSTSSVEVEVDKVLANSPTGPQLYNLSATVPSGAKFTRIGFKGTGNWIKTDMWCVTTNTPPTCNAKVTSLYFNKLDGGTDIPITNGSSFTSAQLGSLYNMEAGTSGTVGSVKFTITGPTATSNIENAAPYNSPGTGSGAWTGAAGSYSVNLKTYSSSGATGTLCHDTTITFTLTSSCDCPGNLLTNGSFENSSSGWSVSGGSLTFGTGYVMCGSYNGFLNHSSGTAKVYQDVTSITAGDIINFKGFAGTHAPGLACSPKLSLIFYNSANAVISQVDANVTYDVGSGNQLALYTINTTAPAGAVKVRVQGSITCNTLKIDGFCLTKTSTTVALGNLVWRDTNGDGLNNNGEPGVSGVTVKLYNDADNDNVADGASVSTTTTNSSGNYSFSGLAPGNYIVGIIVPNGYMSSTVNGGDPDNNIDNDDNGQVAEAGNEVRGLAITLTLGGEPGGSTNNTYDFGLINDCNCPNNLLTNGSFDTGTASPWSVSGGTLTFGTSYVMCGTKNGFLNWSSGTAKLWQDVNVTAGSGVNFKGYAGTHAPGLACSPKLSLIFLNAANATISQVDVAVTHDVGSGNQLALYTISATAPAGTVKVRVQGSITCNTLKVDGFCLTTTPAASLGDFVWQDLNSDGAQDAGEPGIPNVTVTLRNSSNVVVGTTTTDANGAYLFIGLVADTYSVTFDTPAGYVPTPVVNNETAGDALDSDPVGGVVAGIVVPAGTSNTTIDAGFVRLVNLSGNVWHDVNAMTDNLVNNSGAAATPVAIPIPANIKAYLVNFSTGLVEKVVAVNPSTGTFLFTNVMPNTTYYVLISTSSGILNAPPPASVLPSGWTHTGQKLGSPALTGHDGLNDGRLVAPVVTTDVINVNFGIRISGGDVVIG